MYTDKIIQSQPTLIDTKVEVVYCRLPNKDEWDEKKKNISDNSQSQFQRYALWQDQCRHWLGRKLVAYLLALYGKSFDTNEICYTQYGRPYIRNFHDFNISHSGDFVIASLTENGMIGIDIEQILNVPIKDFVLALSEDQLNFIYQAEDPLSMFYKIWTMKESIVKLLGVITMPLQNILSDFRTESEHHSYYLKQLEINKGYSCFIATDHIISEFSLAELTFNLAAAS